MIQLAERAHVLDRQKTSEHILENAYHLWNGKAIFEWEIVQLDNSKGPDQDPDIFNMRCPQATANLNAASSWNPLSAIITSDSFDRSITGANQIPALGRCIFCNNMLGANGLCRPCLLLDDNFPINESFPNIKWFRKFRLR